MDCGGRGGKGLLFPSISRRNAGVIWRGMCWRPIERAVSTAKQGGTAGVFTPVLVIYGKRVFTGTG
ncbi:MAG: hypothetical protein LBS35_07605, partial [Synergistaceae bacterium]|nr:hypothetical protein [Synergistaceae bacterium]